MTENNKIEQLNIIVKNINKRYVIKKKNSLGPNKPILKKLLNILNMAISLSDIDNKILNKVIISLKNIKRTANGQEFIKNTNRIYDKSTCTDCTISDLFTELNCSSPFKINTKNGTDMLTAKGEQAYEKLITIIHLCYKYFDFPDITDKISETINREWY